jgi:hypothetical protein
MQGPTSARSRNELGAVALRISEIALWIASATLLAFYAWARLDGDLHRLQHLRMWGEESLASTVPVMPAVAKPDLSLWSRNLIQSYRESLSLPVEHRLAAPHIPDIALHVPIYSDASELHLNRGADVIEDMSLPEGGNLGIAGHRDGYFRALKDLRRGALIDLTHAVDAVHVSRYEHRHCSQGERRAAARDGRADDHSRYLLSLGSAPRRYIVRGALERSISRR